MDLSLKSSRSILGNISKLMVLALMIQITTANPTNPPFNDDQIQLQIIDSEIQLLEANILHQNKEIQHQYTPTHHLNPRELIILEKAFNKLQEPLIRLNSSTQLNSEDKLKLAKSTTVLEDMQKTLLLLNQTLENSNITESTSSGNETDINATLEKILLFGAVSAINQRQFLLAEEHLQLTSNATYEKTIEIVYNYNDDNLKLIQKFYDSVTNADHKFKIIKSLYNSMLNGDEEPQRLGTFMKLVNLGQLLRKDVLHHTTDAAAEQLFFNTMANAMRTPGIQMIADNFLYYDVELVSVAHCVGIALLEDFTPFSQSIYEQAIEKVADKMNFQQLIEAADKKTTHLESKILAHRVIFEKLETEGLLNTNISLLLAASMKRAMIDGEQCKYQNLSSEWKSSYENMKNKLPASIKNLAFSSSVCIKNSYHNEYLFAAGTEFGGHGHDPKRHSVYTWIPKNETNPSKFKWTVTFNYNDKAELSYVDNGEKLFANESNHFEEERRLVFTCQSHVTNPFVTEYKTFWDFEIDGEGFQLKNSKSKEYLYADGDKKLDDKRRYVFTNTTKHKTKDSKWEIIDCSDSS